MLLMLDEVYGELPDQIPGGGWRERLTAMADQHWELYQRVRASRYALVAAEAQHRSSRE